MGIVVTDDGPVRIVTIDRPERRNAVDLATARLLADAFRAFDVDDSVSVAVLSGSGGTFCAGADLKAIADAGPRGEPDRVTEDGDGPMGPTRMLLGKPVIAAIEGFAVAGGLESHSGAISGWWRRTRCSESSADDSASPWSTSGRFGCPA